MKIRNKIRSLIYPLLAMGLLSQVHVSAATSGYYITTAGQMMRDLRSKNCIIERDHCVAFISEIGDYYAAAADLFERGGEHSQSYIARNEAHKLKEFSQATYYLMTMVQMLQDEVAKIRGIMISEEFYTVGEVHAFFVELSNYSDACAMHKNNSGDYTAASALRSASQVWRGVYSDQDESMTLLMSELSALADTLELALDTFESKSVGTVLLTQS